MTELLRHEEAVLMDALKPILLVLAGLVVILGYAGTMILGAEVIFWVAMILMPLLLLQITLWTTKS